MSADVIAVACADLHFSLKPPVARSAETDWLGVQAGYWDQVENVALKYEAPVVVAGDIFDRWNSPPELVNAVIRWFKGRSKKYAVPGNHDLPPGGTADYFKSSYWTLNEAGAIRDVGIGAGASWQGRDFRIHPYAHGKSLDHPQYLGTKGDKTPNIAVVHHYAWFGRYDGHPGANTDHRIPVLADHFKDMDVVIWGDNHKTVGPMKVGDTTHFNPGSFMRRKSDEVDHRPCVGLIREDKTVDVHRLDVGNDRWADPATIPAERSAGDDIDFTEFKTALMKLGESPHDFGRNVTNYLRDKGLVGTDLDRLIQEWMEQSK